MDHFGVFCEQIIDFFDKLVNKVERQGSKVRVVSFVKILVIDIEHFALLRVKRLRARRAKVELA